MIVVINIIKHKNSLIGVYLQKTNRGVEIVDMNTYPIESVRKLLQIGDVIRSLNGESLKSPKEVSKKIFSSGPYLSICIERFCGDEYMFKTM